MPRRISISLPWDPRDAAALLDRARAADAAGVDTIWVNEGFGHDAFSGLVGQHERVTHHGQWYDIERALVMGGDPVQVELPIHLATLHPKSVRLTAELADGWLPGWVPFERLAGAIEELRAWSVGVGRYADAVEVRAPGGITVVGDDADSEAMRAQRRQQLAFFVARNGDFYYRQFVRHGLADEAAAIRRAWTEGGTEAGIAAIPDELVDQLDTAGSVEQWIERLEEQAAAGVDLHQVSVIEEDQARWAEIVRGLIGY